MVQWEEAMKEDPQVVPDSWEFSITPRGCQGAPEATPERGVGSSRNSRDADNSGETFTIISKRSKRDRNELSQHFNSAIVFRNVLIKVYLLPL